MKDEVSQYSLKFRPRRWEDIYGQDKTVKALRKRIIEKDYPTAILLQGKFGCGKTTIAELFAAAMQASLPDGNPDWNNPSCKSILSGAFDRDTVRLDGSQMSGKSDVVDFTRDLMQRPLYDKRKILLIEEIDQISSAGMSSLLKVLENVKPWCTIILLSMEDKVSGAIKSRCQCYNINPVDMGSIMYNLKHIMEETGDWSNEKIPQEFKLDGLAAIANAADGSMRVAVQYLERCIVNEAYTKKEIQALLEVVDESQIWEILDSLLRGEKDESILRSLAWMKTGEPVMHFYNYATMMMAEAILYKETGVACDDRSEPRLKKLSKMPELERLYYCFTLHPQMNKPFLRSSDLVGCIASFYQGLDFRPQAPIVIPQTIDISKTSGTIRMRESAEESKIEAPVRTRATSGYSQVTQTLTIGSPNTPEMGTANGIRTRPPKTDISNLSIVF